LIAWSFRLARSPGASPPLPAQAPAIPFDAACVRLGPGTLRPARRDGQTIARRAAAANQIVNLTLTPQSRPGAAIRHGRCTVPPAQVFSGTRVRESGTEVSLRRPRGVSTHHETSGQPGILRLLDGKRGDARAPERSDIEPNAVRERLGDIFVLSCEAN